jgi:flagellar FliJ protein
VKRSKRLEPVRELIDENERNCALRVSGAQNRLADAERRHAELERYLGEYQQAFQARATAGMGVSGMRDYQTFIARLTEAVKQQELLLEQLRAACERERACWVEAAARKNAVGKVIDKACKEDQKIEDRRQQNELDERAQRQGVAR